MADTISNEEYIERQLAALIEDPKTPPIPLELTPEQFQKYVDVGVDARLLHATTYDATLMLGRMFYAAQTKAREDKKMERAFRHFLLDCSERLIPIFEAYAPGNYCMRKCLEVGHLFADGKVGKAEADESIRELARSLILKDIPIEPFWALASAMFAVGWNWLEANSEEAQEMLDDAAYVVRCAYTICDDVQAERNFQFDRLFDTILDLGEPAEALENALH
ncbi:MAG: hypothetical protein AAF683_01605 [Pseudomonadota bacterium]